MSSLRIRSRSKNERVPRTKAQLERLALEVRTRVGLSPAEQLDPWVLAQDLGVIVVNLREFTERISDDVNHLQLVDPTSFSAVTVPRGGRFMTVMNCVHSLERQRHTLAHELSHVVLEHPPQASFDHLGNRVYPDDLEEEARLLAGSLLAPRAGLIEIYLAFGRDLDRCALHYGISIELMRERWHRTGCAVQLSRRRR